MDLEYADLIIIQGSNFAENHPVGFRFVTKAKERGAVVVHVDPRFTRTSALADLYMPIRSGTDIAFTGGIINYVLQNEAYFKDYVLHYTSASYIVDEAFVDAEDLDGLFSGFDPENGEYDRSSWTYEFEDVEGGGRRPKRDLTLQHPRCSLNLLKRHFARYTPDAVERICGTPQASFLKLCKLLVANSGRERTAVYCYAMGWAQHTVGVQNIRAAATLQALLGNTGRPGGGVMALRGHASIQGSTDIATLYDFLPGYLKAPTLERGEDTFAKWSASWTVKTSWWSNWPKYAISLMKAWYGDAARADNDWAFDYLPKNTGDHSDLPMFFSMKDGDVEGLLLYGQNPAVGGQNAALQRGALERLKWLVVRDTFETESAAFWRREGADPAQIGTEVFFLPAAAIAEKSGTVTNTMRLVQFHEKAVDPPNDARSDLAFTYELGTRLKALYAGSQRACDRPILDLTWSYEHPDEHERALGEPDLDRIMREINGYDIASGEHVAGFADLKDDGSTACGCWVYSGYVPRAGENLTRRRTADGYVSPEWAWAWPMNRRNLYNRASADPAGRPWSERKKLVWWDENSARWTGLDVPDFPAEKPPAYRGDPSKTGLDAQDGDAPFIMQEFGVAEIFGAQGAVDGPFPTHYEPRESPVPNLLYPGTQYNPTLKEWRRRDNPYHAIGDARYPYVVTTYRMTEHQTTGAMSRWLPWLAELQPELFVEISPELAVERGVRHLDWITLETARGEIEAKAMVTGRIAPLRLGPGRFVHQLGLIYHFGYEGLVHGDSANDLPPLVADPNVTIHEGKAFTGNLRLGRRARYRAHTLETESVPPQEQTPCEQPGHPGPVAAGADAMPLDRSPVSPETIMEAAARAHRRDGELA
jgi:formate dehydrogenase major subunit